VIYCGSTSGNVAWRNYRPIPSDTSNRIGCIADEAIAMPQGLRWEQTGQSEKNQSQGDQMKGQDTSQAISRDDIFHGCCV
jgi:hypothetical protein